MASDMDFNGADTQDAAFDLIPANTLVKVCLTVRPGGAGPEGWLTQSKTSPALYLNTEAVVMEGPFARRRIYTRIGFRGKAAGGPGDDTYGNRGRAMIRGILESARGVRADDQSNAARAARAGGFASVTDQIAVTAGVPFNVPGTTNILRVAPCDERLIYNTDPG